MSVRYEYTADAGKEALKHEHPRGYDLVRAIEHDLSADPLTRANLIQPPNLYLQIYTPETAPPVEIMVTYRVSSGDPPQVLITKIKAQLL
jgi:hypothetical protein